MAYSGAITIRKPLFSESFFSKTRGVDHTQVIYLWETANSSPMVSSIIDFVSLWATISHWTVEISSHSTNSKVNFTDDQLNKRFAMQMMRKLEELIQHVLCFGWAAISYTVKDGVPAAEVSGADIIVNVLNPWEYEVRMKLSKRGNRKWMAFERMNTMNQSQRPIPNSRVFIFREPEQWYVGMRPMSPLTKALRAVFQYDEQSALHMIAGHKRAFPVWLYRSNIDKLLFPVADPTAPEGGRLAATNPAGADEDIGDPLGSTIDPEFLRDMNVRRSLDGISRELHKQASQKEDLSMQMFAQTRRRKDAVEEMVRKGVEQPTMPSKLSTPGIELESNVPEAKAPENFKEFQDILIAQICSTLGVPREFIFPGETKLSTDVLLSRKVLETRTTRLHEWLSLVLQQIFLDIHYVDMLEAIEKFSDKLAAIKTREIAEKLDRKTLLQANIMLKEKFRVMVEKDILVSVHFSESTSATPEALLQALQTGVIDHEKYQQLVLAALGIPQSAKADLSEAEHRKLEKALRSSAKPEQRPAKAAARKATETDSAGEGLAKRQKVRETQSLEKQEKQDQEAK